MSIESVSTTDEAWDIDGVSLCQRGWNVTTIGGERYDLPERRGSNIKFAYLPGAEHRPKTPESKVVNLVMWMTGSDPETGLPVGDATLQWNDNWEFIRNLVWKPNGSQVLLTRRWRLSSSAVYGEPILRASALAELTNSMAPKMTGRTRAEFVMELVLADPFFYGDHDAAEIRLAVPQLIVNKGDDVAAHKHMSLIFVGPLSDPVLTNYSTNPPVMVKYNGLINPGQRVSLNISQFQALLTTEGIPGGTNVIGSIEHTGARNWFGLQPKDNYIVLTALAGSGSAELHWQPPYV